MSLLFFKESDIKDAKVGALNFRKKKKIPISITLRVWKYE